ncbi:MAG: glutamate racemase [Lewinellaceae bacterium]|nr:glutamate racemase [Lewinellaceae bacterium]
MTDFRSAAIGVFDSGVGGLTVANAILDLMPAEAIHYVGDTAHLPYGPKPVEEIRHYSEVIVGYLLDQGCKLIVVACNTATAAALEHLRQRWPEVPIVGMEPAVKPATAATRSGVIGVLATRGTITSSRYAALASRYAQDIRMLQDPCMGLVEHIEAGRLHDSETAALLQKVLAPMQAAGADTYVLGCTHYPLVIPLLRELLGDTVTLINPAPAVARQVNRLLSERDLLATTPPERPLLIQATGSLDSFRLLVPQIFHQAVILESLDLGDR